MTTPCDSGDTVNETVFRERICSYPGRSDRQAFRWRNEDITPVTTTDGATGGEKSRRIREGLRREGEIRKNGRQTGVDAHVVSGQRLAGQPVG